MADFREKMGSFCRNRRSGRRDPCRPIGRAAGEFGGTNPFWRNEPIRNREQGSAISIRAGRPNRTRTNGGRSAGEHRDVRLAHQAPTLRPEPQIMKAGAWFSHALPSPLISSNNGSPRVGSAATWLIPIRRPCLGDFSDEKASHGEASQSRNVGRFTGPGDMHSADRAGFSRSRAGGPGGQVITVSVHPVTRSFPGKVPASTERQAAPGRQGEAGRGCFQT